MSNAPTLNRPSDALFVSTNSAAQAYQALSESYSAIEPHLGAPLGAEVPQQRQNVKAMASVPLKRKLLGD
jgi:hypothetical protein